MKKDPDRDLINKMNSALSEEIQETLEKVLAAQLKPILKKFESLEIKLESLDSRMTGLESRMDGLEKEQKKQGRAIKKVQKTLDLGLKVFDQEDARLFKRIKRIEEPIQLPQVS
jgi:hypothetical protein